MSENMAKLIFFGSVLVLLGLVAGGLWYGLSMEAHQLEIEQKAKP